MEHKQAIVAYKQNPNINIPEGWVSWEPQFKLIGGKRVKLKTIVLKKQGKRRVKSTKVVARKNYDMLVHLTWLDAEIKRELKKTKAVIQPLFSNVKKLPILIPFLLQT